MASQVMVKNMLTHDAAEGIGAFIAKNAQAQCRDTPDHVPRTPYNFRGFDRTPRQTINP